MPITWSAAVDEAEHSDRAAQYHRAQRLCLELDPLVQSFRRAILDSGRWPLEDIGNDTTVVMRPATYIQTDDLHWEPRRHVSVAHEDEWWALHDVSPQGKKVVVAVVRPDRSVWLGGSQAEVLARDAFNFQMNAVEGSKDWVPLQLVGYLRSRGIPIPNDG